MDVNPGLIGSGCSHIRMSGHKPRDTTYNFHSSIFYFLFSSKVVPSSLEVFEQRRRPEFRYRGIHRLVGPRDEKRRIRSENPVHFIEGDATGDLDSCGESVSEQLATGGREQAGTGREPSTSYTGYTKRFRRSVHL